MDGKKEVIAHILYAALVALGSLNSVAQPNITAFYSILLNAVASKR